MDSSTTNSSSGNSSTDSWLFISKNSINDDEISGMVGKNPDDNMKTSEEMEDSDGISVISVISNNSDVDLEKPNQDDPKNESRNVEEAIEAIEKDDESDSSADESPTRKEPRTLREICEAERKLLESYTPERTALKEFEAPETLKIPKTNHGVLLLILVSLVMAVLYTNVSSLKAELAKTIAIYEQRILRLEQENQVLRTQLDDLMKTVGKFNQFESKPKFTPTQQPPQYRHDNKENIPFKPPPTKKVWMGGEKEEVVRVLDKKYSNSLPDYCYFTDEDDLFYEYNMENCEKKKQKMEEKFKIFEKTNNLIVTQQNIEQAMQQSKDKMYDNLMTKTADEILHSLNDEIQEIKNSRVPQPAFKNNYNNEHFDKIKTEKNNFIKEKYKQPSNNYEGSADREKKRKEKKQSQEQQYGKKTHKMPRKDPVKTGDWIDQRSKAREDARMKVESDENWYLKRKNEREIHRMDALRG